MTDGEEWSHRSRRCALDHIPSGLPACAPIERTVPQRAGRNSSLLGTAGMSFLEAVRLPTGQVPARRVRRDRKPGGGVDSEGGHSRRRPGHTVDVAVMCLVAAGEDRAAPRRHEVADRSGWSGPSYVPGEAGAGAPDGRGEARPTGWFLMRGAPSPPAAVNAAVAGCFQARPLGAAERRPPIRCHVAPGAFGCSTPVRRRPCADARGVKGPAGPSISRAGRADRGEGA